MPDEDRQFFHSGEPPRSKPDGGLEFIMGQNARLPTRWELTKYAFVILAVGAVLGIVATEAFWRYLPACGAPKSRYLFWRLCLAQATNIPAIPAAGNANGRLALEPRSRAGGAPGGMSRQRGPKGGPLSRAAA
jgi:hypothetical protein